MRLLDIVQAMPAQREEAAGALLRARDHAPSGWLHPLVVDPPYEGQGVGAALVRALEERAGREGALTLYLGTDDDWGGTSLCGQDLFPDPLDALARLAPAPGAARHHPHRRVGPR